MRRKKEVLGAKEKFSSSPIGCLGHNQGININLGSIILQRGVTESVGGLGVTVRSTFCTIRNQSHRRIQSKTPKMLSDEAFTKKYPLHEAARDGNSELVFKLP